MKENTAEVVRKMLEFSRTGFEIFSEGAKVRRHLPDWMELYEGAASIFEGYVSVFELILRMEDAQGHSPNRMSSVRSAGHLGLEESESCSSGTPP